MGWVVSAIPGHFTTGKGAWYTFYSWLGGFQGRSERVRKTSPPPGFYPRTLKPAKLAKKK